ncbi:hypothetical protein L6R29_20315 [Myxococcota bacterium]|nr:hypothetical protein [Myxococcota bacterium]
MSVVRPPLLIQAKDPAPVGAVWRLTPLDEVNQALIIRGTWIFDALLDVERLKETLGLLLSDYPHLAGRMKQGVGIALDNAGVPFHTAERFDIKIADIEADHTLAQSFARPPDKKAFRRGKEAGIAICVSSLHDGTVLSVCSSHALMDGNSFYTMVANWGRLYAGKSMVAPCLDQSLVQVFQPTEPLLSKKEVRERVVAAGWIKPSFLKLMSGLPLFLFGGILQRTRPIFLSQEALAGLRKRTEETAGKEIGLYALLCAHLSRSCAQLFHASASVACGQVSVLDGRERLAGIPPEFVGNASFVASGGAFRSDEPLVDIAARTQEALAPSLARPSPKLMDDLRLTLQLMRHRGLFYLPYDLAAIYNYRPSVFYVNNFSKFPIYGVDFGDCARSLHPVLVIPHNLPDPILIWPAPPAKGGLEVYLTGFLARGAHKQPIDGAWWRSLRLEPSR